MKWSTIQKDGQIRTIDTDNDSLLSLGSEFAMMSIEAREEREARGIVHKEMKFNNNFWIYSAAFILLLILMRLT